MSCSIRGSRAMIFFTMSAPPAVASERIPQLQWPPAYTRRLACAQQNAQLPPTPIAAATAIARRGPRSAQSHCGTTGRCGPPSSDRRESPSPPSTHGWKHSDMVLRRKGSFWIISLRWSTCRWKRCKSVMLVSRPEGGKGGQNQSCSAQLMIAGGRNDAKREIKGISPITEACGYWTSLFTRARWVNSRRNRSLTRNCFAGILGGTEVASLFGTDRRGMLSISVGAF